jgi:hypothetical protein
MEPIVVAVIAVIGGAVSGLIVSVVKPFTEYSLEMRRERALLRRGSLDRLSGAMIARGAPPAVLRVDTASIDDPVLTAHIGRYLTGTDQDRTDAQGDIAHRVGELRAKLYR